MQLGTSPLSLTTMTLVDVLQSKEPPVKLPLEWKVEPAFPSGAGSRISRKALFHAPLQMRFLHRAGVGEPPFFAVTGCLPPQGNGDHGELHEPVPATLPMSRFL